MGLWDPIEPAPLPAASPYAKKHLRVGGAARHKVRASPRRVATSPQSGVGPPVPANAAFLLAAVAAALAAFISVPARRLLSRGFHGGLDALSSRPLHAAWGSRRWNWSVSNGHPRLPRPVKPDVAFATAVARRSVQIRATLLEAVTVERRRSRAWSPSSIRAATSGTIAAPRSMLAFSSAKLGKLVHTVTRGRRPAGAALRTTAFRFRQAGRIFLRHWTDVAPYVISMVVSVVFGWLVAVLINQ
jgi:hypothetical protein